MAVQIQAAKPGIVFTIGRAVLRPLLWLRYRPRVSGYEHVPESGPVLLASNHLAKADTILIPSFSPRKVQFLAKAGLFESPIGGWFFRHIGAVPVHRDVGSAAQAALQAGMAVLEAGQVFAVFPEGSRSLDGRLYRGHSGAAYLALATGATVIPVGLINNSLTAEIKFGAALDFSDLAELPGGKARAIATERIMSAIQSLTGQIRSDEYAAGSRDG